MFTERELIKSLENVETMIVNQRDYSQEDGDKNRAERMEVMLDVLTYAIEDIQNKLIEHTVYKNGSET